MVDFRYHRPIITSTCPHKRSLEWLLQREHYPCCLWRDKCDFWKIFWIISSSKFYNSFTPRGIYLWHSYEVHEENICQTLVFLSDNSDLAGLITSKLLPEFWIQFRESLPILNSLTKNESPNEESVPMTPLRGTKLGSELGPIGPIEDLEILMGFFGGGVRCLLVVEKKWILEQSRGEMTGYFFAPTLTT